MYSLSDFQMYYKNAWMQVPGEEKTIAKVLEVQSNSTVIMMTPAGRRIEQSFDSLLDWKRLAGPELGWRSAGPDGVPVYFYRNPGAMTPKGLRPDLLTMYYPPNYKAVASIPISEVFFPKVETDLDVAIADIYEGRVYSRALSSRVIACASFASFDEPSIDIYHRLAKIGTVNETGVKCFATEDLPEELIKWA